jgi:hypothetical protein
MNPFTQEFHRLCVAVTGLKQLDSVTVEKLKADL